MSFTEPPRCRYGYTRDQLEKVIPDMDAFWAEKQNLVSCEGTECKTAHGPVVRQWDVESYLAERVLRS